MGLGARGALVWRAVLNKCIDTHTHTTVLDDPQRSKHFVERSLFLDVSFMLVPRNSGRVLLLPLLHFGVLLSVVMLPPQLIISCSLHLVGFVVLGSWIKCCPIC